ncbi:hypothetical protein C5167_029936 [Papaver somniferum]|nr:hypothetical protein C5167_029936 [Papaver somniferum]
MTHISKSKPMYQKKSRGDFVTRSSCFALEITRPLDTGQKPFRWMNLNPKGDTPCARMYATASAHSDGMFFSVEEETPQARIQGELQYEENIMRAPIRGEYNEIGKRVLITSQLTLRKIIQGCGNNGNACASCLGMIPNYRAEMIKLQHLAYLKDKHLVFGCKVLCYTHYPTISLDMVSRVRQRDPMYNTDPLIAMSWMYGFVGSCTHLAVVNSSWTQDHIVKLWGIPRRTKRIYPPCDTKGLQEIPLERPINTPTIISVAQFRLEKAHILQLDASSVAIENLDPNSPRPKLQFMGSCRIRRKNKDYRS